jgi:DNA anti-recombination protein RmuC
MARLLRRYAPRNDSPLVVVRGAKAPFSAIIAAAMADSNVDERVNRLEERVSDMEFTIREIGENTRSQLAAMRQEMYKALGDIRQDMQALRSEVYRALDGMQGTLREMKQEMQGAIQESKQEMQGTLREMRQELRDLRNHTFGALAVAVALISLVVYLAR